LLAGRFGNRADRMLLQNSQAFDLGLDNEPTQEQVEALVRDMEERYEWHMSVSVCVWLCV